MEQQLLLRFEKLKKHLFGSTAEKEVKLIETQNFPDDFTKQCAIGDRFGFLYAKEGRKEALKFAEMMEIPHETACENIDFIEQVWSKQEIKDFDTLYARGREKELEKMIADDPSSIEYLNRLRKADKFLESRGF